MPITTVSVLQSKDPADLAAKITTACGQSKQPLGSPIYAEESDTWLQAMSDSAVTSITEISLLQSLSATNLASLTNTACAAGKQPLGGPVRKGRLWLQFMSRGNAGKGSIAGVFQLVPAEGGTYDLANDAAHSTWLVDPASDLEVVTLHLLDGTLNGNILQVSFNAAFSITTVNYTGNVNMRGGTSNSPIFAWKDGFWYLAR